MRKAAHRVSLEAGDTLRQGSALGDSEVVNLLVGTIHIISALHRKYNVHCINVHCIRDGNVHCTLEMECVTIVRCNCIADIMCTASQM
jgi:hypothetical protein